MKILVVPSFPMGIEAGLLASIISDQLRDEVRSRVMLAYPPSVSHENSIALTGELGINSFVDSRLVQPNEKGILEMLESYGQPRRLNALIVMAPSDDVAIDVAKCSIKNAGGQWEESNLLLAGALIVVDNTGAISHAWIQ